MRRRTLAVLQAAFSTVLASCAPPPPALTPSEPTSSPSDAPAVVAPSAPSAPATPTAVAPSSPAVSEPTSPATPLAAPAGFVDGDPNARNVGQLCLGNVVPSWRPGRPVDSLEMRLLQRRDREVHVLVTGRAGSPCGTAKDRDACQRAYDAVRPRTAEEILVFTRGDEVGVVERGGVPAFLAPIDSPEEAAAVLVYTPPDDRADVSCDASSFKATKAGFTSTQERWNHCDRDVTTYSVAKDGKARRVGTKHVQGRRPCHMPVPGRRPEGLAGRAPNEDDGIGPLGAYLAEACTLEAASVTSFRRLERELSSLGAPRGLRRRARRSAGEEASHARTMRRLARRFGAEPRPPRIASVAARSPVAIALENVVEGCVHETWAALVARFQAEHASDPELRAAMRAIAADEAKHAALAWDVHAWLDARLSTKERDRVRAAYDRALGELVQDQGGEMRELDRQVLGLPSLDTARALATAWAATAPSMA